MAFTEPSITSHISVTDIGSEYTPKLHMHTGNGSKSFQTEITMKICFKGEIRATSEVLLIEIA